MHDKKMSNNYDRLDSNDDNMKLHRQRELFEVEKWKIYGYSTKPQVEPWRCQDVRRKKIYKGSEYKDYSTSRTSNDVHKVQTKPNKGSEYKDYSTSRTSNGVHKVQMKSTKVHPRNESQKKKKLNPVYNLGFTQKWQTKGEGLK